MVELFEPELSLCSVSQCPNVRVERFPGGMFGFLAARAVRQGEELFVAPVQWATNGLGFHPDSEPLYWLPAEF